MGEPSFFLVYRVNGCVFGFCTNHIVFENNTPPETAYGVIFDELDHYYRGSDDIWLLR